jgi:hypothetical protein
VTPHRQPDRRSRGPLALTQLAALALAIAACGSVSPAKGTYTLDFPSTLDAIASDGVQVFVFPYDGSADTCAALVEERKTGSPLPTPLAQTAQQTPCSLQSGAAPLPDMSFGQYAFLAVATRTQYGDFLIGCAAQTLSSTNTLVTIPLELTDFQNPLPTTKCTSLSQSCAGGC